jgi:hypothetical protein
MPDNFLRASLTIVTLLLLWVPSIPALAQSAPPCQFILGFAALDAMLPVAAGDCLDNQTFAANGDAVQHTTVGEFVWRKADNWTAFTDGYHTWVNGPYGLQERLNSERFSWEANPDGLPVVGSSPSFGGFAGNWVSHGMTMSFAVSGVATLDWRIYSWCGPGVSPPCDQTIGNTIVDGGHATAQFDAVQGSTASGQVQSTTDPSTIAAGPISVTLISDGNALQIAQAGTQGNAGRVLCSPQHYDSSLCGA